ncbi:MAG: hypothetical protein ACK5O8_17605, partial [Pirellula sp.]
LQGDPSHGASPAQYACLLGVFPPILMHWLSVSPDGKLFIKGLRDLSRGPDCVVNGCRLALIQSLAVRGVA